MGGSDSWRKRVKHRVGVIKRIARVRLLAQVAGLWFGIAPTVAAAQTVVHAGYRRPRFFRFRIFTSRESVA